MFTEARFIEEKSTQLVFYLHGFWTEHIPYSELQLFLWDTLEEWYQYTHDDDEALTHQERVFWHLLHEIQSCSEVSLCDEQERRDELHQCAQFLQGVGQLPDDCIGVRP